MPCLRCGVGKFTVDVKARPNSLQTAATAYDDEYLHVNIGAAPDRDRANKELTRYLSQVFGTPKCNVNILRGKTSRCKVVEVVALLTSAEVFDILDRTIVAGRATPH